MDKKQWGRANKYLLIALIVILLACIGEVSFIGIKKVNSKDAKVKQTVTENIKSDTNFSLFEKFIASESDKAKAVKAIKNEDLFKLSNSVYDVAHVSMWDTSMLSNEWYSFYFGETILYPEAEYETPQELHDNLEGIFENESKVKKVYVNIDPYALYKNYYESIYYESEILPFEEYLADYIFPFLEDHQDVMFDFYFPNKPLSYWRSIPIDEVIEIFDSWYRFAMYLRWYENARTAYLGAEEWLAVNENNFESEYILNEEISLLTYLYLYAYDEYTVTPPEINAAKNSVLNYIVKAEHGDYVYTNFDESEIVLLGDSVFAFVNQHTVSISGFIEALTDVPCINIALGGTTASKFGEDSFTDVANRLVAGNLGGMDGDIYKDVVHPGDDVLFIISYGFNDYFNGLSIDEFEGGLTEGIKQIKKDYPNCEILLVAPYTLGIAEGGAIPYTEGGHLLEEYVEAAERISELEDIHFCNLIEKSGITFENSTGYLVDGVHPRLSACLFFAKLILDSMS